MWSPLWSAEAMSEHRIGLTRVDGPTVAWANSPEILLREELSRPRPTVICIVGACGLEGYRLYDVSMSNCSMNLRWK